MCEKMPLSVREDCDDNVDDGERRNIYILCSRPPRRVVAGYGLEHFGTRTSFHSACMTLAVPGGNINCTASPSYVCCVPANALVKLDTFISSVARPTLSR